MQAEKTLVSACLAGRPCRYDGGFSEDAGVYELVVSHRAVAVCPERLGGRPTPRPPAEIIGGDGNDVLDGRARVVDCHGNDVTQAFIKGAYAALEAAGRAGIRMAILKAKSPSCGCAGIYDGSFSGRLIDGDGVTAALFKRNGIEVQTR